MSGLSFNDQDLRRHSACSICVSISLRNNIKSIGLLRSAWLGSALKCLAFRSDSLRRHDID
jgi:hypothetical protein